MSVEAVVDWCAAIVVVGITALFIIIFTLFVYTAWRTIRDGTTD